HIGTEDHQGADGVGRKRGPDTGGMTADQIDLELVEPVGGHAHIGQLPEPGVDPVDRLPARNVAIYQRAALTEGGTRRGLERNPAVRIARGAGDGVNGERSAVEHEWGGRHARKIARLSK